MEHCKNTDECYPESIDISTFKNKVFSRIERIVIPIEIDNEIGDAVLWIEENGTRYLMYKQPQCCCRGEIKDIVGELSSLINTPLLNAECVTKEKSKDDAYDPWENSCTWTFYKLATINGYVDISWFSASNGHYSEEVSILPLCKHTNISQYGSHDEAMITYLMNL